MGFTGRYRLEEIGYRLWWYEPDPWNPLAYVTRDGRRFEMWRAFETDGATVPRVFWSVPGFDPWDWPKAAILHDALYEMHHRGEPEVGFIRANWLLFESLRSLGWPWLLAALVFFATTLFGWIYWYRR